MSGFRRPTTWLDRLLKGRLRPLPATLIGLGLVLAIVAAVSPADEELTTTTKTIFLVVPVVLAAVIGGRRSAYVVALGASFAFGFMVPPYGSIRVELEKDLVALVVFLLVAILVSTVVARRIEILGEVERQRAALLRSVSHDFRTPLAVIRAASTDMLDTDAHSPESRRRTLTLIVEETERLDRLVTNLLDLSRIESGVLEPQRQPVDLGVLVAAAVARLDRLFVGLTLDVDVASEVEVIEADATLMDQLISNLLENAARHSPAGSAVRFAARRVGQSVVIVVTDDGPGVPVERRNAAFESFQAAGVAAGAGVGLAICKAIAEAHHGTIDLGDAPGGGAMFTVTMPQR